MRRITNIIGGSQGWRSLAALALAGIAVSSTAFSDATFTSATGNPGTSYAAGTIQVTDSKAGNAVLDATAMKPGVSRQGTVQITNSGTHSATLALEATDLSSSPSSPALASTLDLKVEDVTGSATTIYTGKLGSYSSASLGTFAAAETRTYRFTYSWPATDTNPALQAATTSSTFRWKATS